MSRLKLRRAVKDGAVQGASDAEFLLPEQRHKIGRCLRTQSRESSRTPLAEASNLFPGGLVPSRKHTYPF